MKQLNLKAGEYVPLDQFKTIKHISGGDVELKGTAGGVDLTIGASFAYPVTLPVPTKGVTAKAAADAVIVLGMGSIEV